MTGPLSQWRGGFSWDGSALQFNWHPVLMVSGLVVLYGIALVVYRVPSTWKQKKHPWKLVHAGLMLLALLLSILGLCAVFDFHKHFNLPDLYSLHSWVGICTVAMFWILGLAGFLVPCSPLWFRNTLKPVHIWLGKAILILSLISLLNYPIGDKHTKFANSLGILIVAFGLVVFGILSKNKWQRPETEGESVHVSMDVMIEVIALLPAKQKKTECPFGLSDLRYGLHMVIKNILVVLMG
uniref:Lysosomal membrane ascorbate-dependent ferrireductase CYB561A3 n=1 Tax=Lates calcarifer TaxID=8187 RepID=A0A4W6CEW0_LATCA